MRYKYKIGIVGLLFLLLTNHCVNKTRQIHIFIPENYTGWVNIFFNEKGTNHRAFDLGNNYMYIITGDPEEYKVINDIFDPDRYNMHYHYYSKDTLYEIQSLSYPTNQVFFEAVRKTNMYDFASPEKDYLFWSFYVSKVPLKIKDVNEDKLEKNKW